MIKGVAGGRGGPGALPKAQAYGPPKDNSGGTPSPFDFLPSYAQDGENSLAASAFRNRDQPLQSVPRERTDPWKDPLGHLSGMASDLGDIHASIAKDPVGSLAWALGAIPPALGQMGQSLYDSAMAPVRAYRGELADPEASARELALNLAGTGGGRAVAKGFMRGAGDAPELGIFGGRLAKTADHAALAKAEAADAAGVPREDIWKQHGWFKGVDGKWRFEIDDSGAKLVGDSKDTLGVSFEDHMNHPELKAAYWPEKHKSPNVVYGDTDGAGGSYRGDGYDIIKLNNKKPINDASVTLHEATHAIQDREKFATGGNLESVVPNALGYTPDIGVLNQATLIKNIGKDWPGGLDSFLKDHPNKLPDGTEYETAALHLARSPDKLNRAWTVYNVNTDPMLTYKHLAGEAEARLAQSRANLTPAERQAHPPWEKGPFGYDVPEDQQIVRFGDNGPAASMGSDPFEQIPFVDELAGKKKYPNKAAFAKEDFANLVKEVEQAKAMGIDHPMAGIYQLNPPGAPSAAALPMDLESRMARLKDGGFADEPVLYHGTTGVFPFFDKSKFGGSTKANGAHKAAWLVDDPMTASGYADYAAGKPVRDLVDTEDTYKRLAQKSPGNDKYWEDKQGEALASVAAEIDRRFGPGAAAQAQNNISKLKAGVLEQDGILGQSIMPLRIKGKLLNKDFNGAEYNDVSKEVSQLLREAQSGGFDGVKMQNLADDVGFNAKPKTHYAIFDPRNIRSIHAAFDPAKADSADLLASLGVPQKPPQIGQLPFSADYPAGAPEGLPLSKTIEGIPLTAKHVAGRRVGGGPDQALNPSELDDMLKLLNYEKQLVPKSDLPSKALGSINHGTRKVSIFDKLGPLEAEGVTAHEAGHAIDKAVGTIDPAGHSADLTKAFSAGHDGNFKRTAHFLRPSDVGYSKAEAPAENMAEALRMYLQNPNWMKANMPDLAAKLRKSVNANPRVNHVIQLNTGGLGPIGMIAGTTDRAKRQR